MRQCDEDNDYSIYIVFHANHPPPLCTVIFATRNFDAGDQMYCIFEN